MSDERKRRPPAYQVYAADDLAGPMYYPLTAGERGVLDAMQRACWVEDTIPSDPTMLALVLRLKETDLRPFLTKGVLAHFEQDDGNPGRLRSRELRRQMANLMEVRERQRQGGKEGAKITNSLRNGRPRPATGHTPASVADTHTTLPAGQLAGPEVNRDDVSRKEPRCSVRSDHSVLNPEQVEWIRDFNEAEKARDVQ